MRGRALLTAAIMVAVVVMCAAASLAASGGMPRLGDAGDLQDALVAADSDKNAIARQYEVPPTDVCPNIEDVQTTVPPNHTVIGGACVPVNEQEEDVVICIYGFATHEVSPDVAAVLVGQGIATYGPCP